MSYQMASPNMIASHSAGSQFRRYAASVHEYIDVHINPIVVKEARQAVRSRFIQVVINLMLLLQLVIAAIALLSSMGHVDYLVGRELFFALNWLLLLGASFFVPLYVGVRFAAERASQNIDLMYNTTLTPFSIVWGKFLTGVVVTILLFSTAAPFMVLTYMLRGIDVPTILMILGLDLVLVLGAIQVIILMLAGVTSFIGRGGMLAGWLALMVWIFAGAVVEFSDDLYRSSNINYSFDELIFPVLGLLWLLLSMHICMMFASTALLSPPHSNRAFGFRVAIIVCWIVSGLIALVYHLIHDNEILLVLWAVYGMLFAMVMFYISICERDHLAARVLAQVPRNPLLRRLAFLFFSGSTGGGMLWMLVICVSVVIFLASIATGTHTSDLDDQIVFGIFIFVANSLAYGLTAFALVRYLGRDEINNSVTAGLAVFLLVLGCLAPPVFSWTIDPEDWTDQVWWGIGNPLGGFALTDSLRLVFLGISFIWLLVMLAVCLPLEHRQYAAFRRLPIPTPPLEADSSQLTPTTPLLSDEPDTRTAKAGLNG